MIRALKPEDRDMLAAWIADDPLHGHVQPDFFYAPGAQTYIVEDREGAVLAYRISKVLRVDIQFQQDQPRRTARALMEGFKDLLDRGPKAGFSQLIFDSVYRPLIRFAKMRLGFRASQNEYVRDIR